MPTALWSRFVRPFFSNGTEPGGLRAGWRTFVRLRARETADGLLPQGERWRRVTWRHFRHRVLSHLAYRGALSLDELEADPPAILSLHLNRDELVAVLDSARRRGLVEPLGHSKRPNGAAAPDEWTLTDAGRRSVRRLGPVIAGSLRTWLGIGGTLLGIFGTTVTLNEVGLSLGEAVALALPLGIVLSFALHMRSLWVGALPARSVAHDWQRWKNERPGDYQRTAMFFPLRSLLASMLVFWGSLIGLALLDVTTPIETPALLDALLPLVLVAFTGRRLLEWTFRWPPTPPAQSPADARVLELQQDEDVDHEEDREEDRPAVQVALDERAAAEGTAAAADPERS